mmetsp:Transcript_3988/g.13964  ORF Transcript_3988/g.13964 Transcript_3988/m.13964 type:complete len:274 (+) Transcript_3988:1646-2467(+)
MGIQKRMMLLPSSGSRLSFMGMAYTIFLAFLLRMLKKALHDFNLSPMDTVFIFVVPYWDELFKKDGELKTLVNQFQVAHIYPAGTEKLFSVSSEQAYSKDQLDPAGDDGGPNRFFVGPTPWPVAVLYKDFRTVPRMDPVMEVHCKLGHPGRTATQELIRDGNDFGLNPSQLTALRTLECPVCDAAKMTKPRAPRSEPDSKDIFRGFGVFGKLFMDIQGPISPEGYDGQRYIIAAVTLCGRWAFTEAINTKDQASAFLHDIVASIKSMCHEVAF